MEEWRAECSWNRGVGRGRKGQESENRERGGLEHMNGEGKDQNE